MDSTLAQEIITKTLSFSAADETEVLLTHSEENLTRFSDNIITQNVARLTDSLTVKVHCGKKVGRAGVNQFDDDTLRRSVETAQKIACQQRDTPDLLPLLGPTQFAKTDAFTEATAVYGPEERAKVVRRLVTEAEKHHASAAGIFSNGWDAVALGNSKGLFGYHRASKAIFSATVEIGGQPGWAEDIQQDVNRIEVESVIAASIHKAEQARNPITMPPGEYTVVLEPAAVTDFLMFMAFEGFGGLNYAEGRSFLSGKLGEKVLGDNITIVDDAYDAMNPGLPFDFEGVPRQKLILIEHGIARQVAHDRYTAKQANAATQQHGCLSSKCPDGRRGFEFRRDDPHDGKGDSGHSFSLYQCAGSHQVDSDWNDARRNVFNRRRQGASCDSQPSLHGKRRGGVPARRADITGKKNRRCVFRGEICGARY